MLRLPFGNHNILTSTLTQNLWKQWLYSTQRKLAFTVVEPSLKTSKIVSAQLQTEKILDRLELNSKKWNVSTGDRMRFTSESFRDQTFYTTENGKSNFWVRAFIIHLLWFRQRKSNNSRAVRAQIARKRSECTEFRRQLISFHKFARTDFFSDRTGCRSVPYSKNPPTNLYNRQEHFICPWSNLVMPNLTQVFELRANKMASISETQILKRRPGQVRCEVSI